MSEEDKAKVAEKVEASHATWKFELEDTVNADPKCRGDELKVLRAYLNYHYSHTSRPFVSMPDLVLATGLAENTVRKVISNLNTLGYFEPDGRSDCGSRKFKITNARYVEVLDYKMAFARKLTEKASAKKAIFRARQAAKYGSTGDMSPANSEGPFSSVPLKSDAPSPSVHEGNNVSSSAVAYGVEGREHTGRVLSDDWYTTEELATMNANGNRSPHTYGDDDEAMFEAPHDDAAAKATMDAIVAHFEDAGYRLSSFTLATLETMYRRGVLSAANARQIVENSSKRGANAAA